MGTSEELSFLFVYFEGIIGTIVTQSKPFYLKKKKQPKPKHRDFENVLKKSNYFRQ